MAHLLEPRLPVVPAPVRTAHPGHDTIGLRADQPHEIPEECARALARAPVEEPLYADDGIGVACEAPFTCVERRVVCTELRVEKSDVSDQGHPSPYIHHGVYQIKATLQGHPSPWCVVVQEIRS